LLLAAYTGYLSVVRLLVERCANVHATNPQCGTALRSAADAGHIEIVRYLLGLGARSDIRDKFGLLPIDYARRNGHAEIVKLLSSPNGETTHCHDHSSSGGSSTPTLRPTSTNPERLIAVGRTEHYVIRFEISTRCAGGQKLELGQGRASRRRSRNASCSCRSCWATEIFSSVPLCDLSTCRKFSTRRICRSAARHLPAGSRKSL